MWEHLTQLMKLMGQGSFMIPCGGFELKFLFHLTSHLYFFRTEEPHILVLDTSKVEQLLYGLPYLNSILDLKRNNSDWLRYNIGVLESLCTNLWISTNSTMKNKCEYSYIEQKKKISLYFPSARLLFFFFYTFKKYLLF